MSVSPTLEEEISLADPDRVRLLLSKMEKLSGLKEDADQMERKRREERERADNIIMGRMWDPQTRMRWRAWRRAKERCGQIEEEVRREVQKEMDRRREQKEDDEDEPKKVGEKATVKELLRRVEEEKSRISKSPLKGDFTTANKIKETTKTNLQSHKVNKEDSEMLLEAVEPKSKRHVEVKNYYSLDSPESAASFGSPKKKDSPVVAIVRKTNSSLVVVKSRSDQQEPSWRRRRSWKAVTQLSGHLLRGVDIAPEPAGEVIKVVSSREEEEERELRHQRDEVGIAGKDVQVQTDGAEAEERSKGELSIVEGGEHVQSTSSDDEDDTNDTTVHRNDEAQNEPGKVKIAVTELEGFQDVSSKESAGENEDVEGSLGSEMATPDGDDDALEDDDDWDEEEDESDVEEEEAGYLEGSDQRQRQLSYEELRRVVSKVLQSDVSDELDVHDAGEGKQDALGGHGDVLSTIEEVNEVSTSDASKKTDAALSEASSLPVDANEQADREVVPVPPSQATIGNLLDGTSNGGVVPDVSGEVMKQHSLPGGLKEGSSSESKASPKKPEQENEDLLNVSAAQQSSLSSIETENISEGQIIVSLQQQCSEGEVDMSGILKDKQKTIVSSNKIDEDRLELSEQEEVIEISLGEA